MAWIYLAESEGLHSLYQSGSGQSPIVKSINTSKGFYSVECRPENYPLHRFGMILDTSDQKETLTLFTGDSHARISVVQELEQAWKQSEAVYSLKWSGSQKRLDLPLYSWKTSPPLKSLCHEYGPSLRNLATIAEMDSYPLPKLELLTSVKDGSFLPTLTASEGGYNKSINSKNKRGSLTTIVRKATGLTLNPRFAEWFMGYREGWTELEDWVMQWFQSKQGKRLKS